MNHPQAPYHLHNTGMIVRRTVWDDCGGYKPLPSPDTYLQLCAISKGWRIAIVRNALMLFLRPVRLDPYKVGLAEGMLGGGFLYVMARSLKYSLTTSNLLALTAMMAGYLRGRMSYGGVVNDEVKRVKSSIERLRLRSLVKSVAKKIS